MGVRAWESGTTYGYDFLIFLVPTQEVMESLKISSDAELMQIAIDDLNNSSLSLEEHHRALQELLILVEPIDNAKGGYNFCHFYVEII